MRGLWQGTHLDPVGIQWFLQNFLTSISQRRRVKSILLVKNTDSWAEDRCFSKEGLRNSVWHGGGWPQGSVAWGGISTWQAAWFIALLCVWLFQVLGLFIQGEEKILCCLFLIPRRLECQQTFADTINHEARMAAVPLSCRSLSCTELNEGEENCCVTVVDGWVAAKT